MGETEKIENAAAFAEISTELPDAAIERLGCLISDATEHIPADANYYFETKNQKITQWESHNPGFSRVEGGSLVVFECIDAKSKRASRECLSDGSWSPQSSAIRCDSKRYWIAVIAAATSAFIIIVLFIYFTCSAYNKRKKRKYIARKERIREQDDLMLRNENFVRLNFRPMQLRTISQNTPSEHHHHHQQDDYSIQPTAPPPTTPSETTSQTPTPPHRS